MTKVEAIRQVLEDNHGVATWEIIYNQIRQYCPDAMRSAGWKACIRGVVYREIKNGRSFKMVDTGLVGLMSYDERDQLLDEDRLLATDRSIQTFVRVGQERFRRKLLRILKYCPVTGIDDDRLLLASHIKPWAVSTNEERMDIKNGFILSPTVDKLFDKGLITFEDDKRILLSPSLSRRTIERLGIEHGKMYRDLPVKSREGFLAFHRENIFVQK